MKLLDRYVGREILMTSLFAIAVLSLVLVLGNVFKQLLDLLVNREVPLEYVISFIAYILPFSLTFTIPWGFLTAVLLVFGKMSAENELVALRSNGVSIARTCVAVFALTAVAVGVCFWINIEVAPRAQVKMKNSLFHIVTANPIAMFGNDHVIDEFPGKRIYVEKKEGTKLRNILVYELTKDDEPLNVIHAKSGELETDPKHQQVLLHINDGRYERRDPQNPGDLTRIQQGITIKETVFPISLTELYERSKRGKGLSQMTLKELLRNKESESDINQRTAKRTETNKRFSFSLASFAFALIGVPLAITAHRRETSIGFLLSVVVAFVYFFFIIIANTLRDNPKFHPELLIWAPNVLFISLGSYMFWRLNRK